MLGTSSDDYFGWDRGYECWQRITIFHRLDADRYDTRQQVRMRGFADSWDQSFESFHDLRSLGLLHLIPIDIHSTPIATRARTGMRHPGMAVS